MILLPPRFASLTHKIAKDAQKFMARVPWDANIDRPIDRSEEVFVEYPVRVISVAVLVAVV